jgi:hypothetical protein
VLAPGQYVLRAHVPARNAVAGAERPVSVEGPVAGLRFSLARVAVRGRVVCLSPALCDAVVTLVPSKAAPVQIQRTCPRAAPVQRRRY